MSRPIPIAFGITDLDVGGAEKNLVELVTRFDRREWAPSVVVLQPPGPLAQVLAERGVPVQSLRMRSIRDLPGALYRWHGILRKEHPAILQTFLFHANLLGRMAGWLAGVPNRVSGIRVADRRRRKHFSLDRWTSRLATKHVCVSAGVRDFASTQLRLPPEHFVVIPNGIDVSRWDSARPVDLARFTSGANKGDHGPAVLLYVGRLDEQKGLLDLIESLDILAQRGRAQERLRVLLLGEGPLREELETLIGRRALASWVHLVGWQPNPAEWLAAADGLVLPSLWEGMPNVVLEAMAMRLPVIATEVEGSSELVQPGETGWLVPPGSPPMLAKAIDAFLENPRLRQDFGAAARHRVEADFSIDHMVEQYVELYRDLLATSRWQ